MPQRFEVWCPVNDLPPWFSGYSLQDDQASFRLRLYPTKNDFRDLVVTFEGGVIAYRVHNEFSHPRFHQESSPVPSEQCPWGTEPLLIVHDSEWLRAFNEFQLAPWFDQVVHYFIYTLDRSVDILAYDEPNVRWDFVSHNDGR